MKNTDQQERRKLILGTLLSLILIAFVLFFAVANRQSYTSKERNGTLKTMAEERTVTLVESGRTVWRYWDAGETPAGTDLRQWTLPDYDDSDWKSGTGTFGSEYGRLEKMVNRKAPRNLLNYYLPDQKAIPAYYFRTEFDVGDLGNVQCLTGKIHYDDAVLMYLNGELIYASNVCDGGYSPENPYGSAARVNEVESDSFVISNLHALKPGRNVLAIELHQRDESSSDIYFDLETLETSSESSRTQPLDLTGLILERGSESGQVIVNWLTDKKGTYELIWASGDDKRALLSPLGRKLMGGQKTGIGGTFSYHGQLSDLPEGQSFVYQIVDLQHDLRSEAVSFSIQPEQPLTFGFVGDVQIRTEHLEENQADWQKAVDTLIQLRPDVSFILTAGDQVNSSNDEKALKEYQAFRSPAALKQIPMAINIGNHEGNEKLLASQFQRLDKGADCYYEYGDTLFYALNCMDEDTQAHLDKLSQVIARTQPRWIIVTMHYSLFGRKDRSEDEKVIVARKAYAEAFSDLNVDVVLSGHDHVYCRSWLMKGAEATDRAEGLKRRGETLYVSGGTPSGSKYYEIQGEAPEWIAYSIPEQQATVSLITISKNQLILETYSQATQELIDRCEIRK